MIPSLASLGALNLGGWTADYAIRRGVGVTRVRKTMQAVGFGGAAAAMSVLGHVENTPLAIFLMSLGICFSGLGAAGFIVQRMRVSLWGYPTQPERCRA